MNTKCLKGPCHECAFSRTSEPGFLGGSAPEVFVGQTFGPFAIPCHLQCDFSDPDWKDKAFDVPQCAGVAVFRSNMGLAAIMPMPLHILPEDHKRVFSTAAEFIAHHRQISVAEAEAQLSKPGQTVGDLVKQQLARVDNRYRKSR